MEEALASKRKLEDEVGLFVNQAAAAVGDVDGFVRALVSSLHVEKNRLCACAASSALNATGPIECVGEGVQLAERYSKSQVYSCRCLSVPSLKPISLLPDCVLPQANRFGKELAQAQKETEEARLKTATLRKDLNSSRLGVFACGRA